MIYLSDSMPRTYKFGLGFCIGTYWGPAGMSHRLSMGGGNSKRPEDTEDEEIPLRRQNSFQTS